MILFFLDTETTGFSTTKNEMIELSYALMVDGITYCKTDLYMKPERWDAISPEALQYNGYTIERLKALPEKKVAIELLFNFMAVTGGLIKGKMQIIEHSKNKAFDNRFLKIFINSYFGRIKYDHFFHQKIISTYDMTRQKLPNLKSYKLANVARALGIPVDDNKLHGAAYDRDLMIWVYRALGGVV